ncbi:protein FLOURY 1-like [Coffea eugenioides]|uniref:protein FLOURY 1-like n=1 Tax=Coffea eugenioides TaxID=49369 RepID=UPI000F60B691|nr:protein FLOURY 1-like [Coffea eugenioides]
MQILSHLCFLLVFCSVLELRKRVLQYFLGFVLMDSLTCLSSYLKQLSCNSEFGCGFLIFWSYKQILKVLGLFLLLGFGLKLIKFRFLCDSGGKSGSSRKGICETHGFDVKCSSKISSCKFKPLKHVHDSGSPVVDKLEKTKLLNSDADGQYEATNVCSEECNKDNDDGDDDENEHCDEDKEVDVLALRRLIKAERRRANSALLELEKERMSSATAVEESMAMILRLQNEKSLIEMESRQYRRLAEEKLLYDDNVISSLQWLVERHESERAVLEDQLRLCEQKLRLFMKSNEMDEFEEVEESVSSSSDIYEDALDLFSSIDMDSSQE